MVLQENIDVILLVTIGTLTFTGILLGFFWFFLTYHNRLHEQQSNHQKELLDAIVQSQETERKNISRELHDGVGASLSIIKLKLSHFQKSKTKETEEILTILDGIISSTKKFSSNLSPSLIDDFGLRSALKNLASEASTKDAMEVDFSTSGNEILLRNNDGLSVFRIVQEILNNLIKHSGADRILISLNYTPYLVEVIVEDNGKKFNIPYEITQGTPSHKGMGLKNIESRINMIGALMKYESADVNKVKIYVKPESNEFGKN